MGTGTANQTTVFVLCKNGTMAKGKNGIGPVFSTKAKLESALRELAGDAKAEIAVKPNGLRISGLAHYAGKEEIVR